MADYSELKQQKSKFCSCTCRCFIKLFAVLVIVLIVGGLTWHLITQPKSTPVITTKDGPIQGHIKYSRDGKKYWQFLSVPYAMPPVGKLKFEPPLPVKPWVNVKEATSYPPSCAQFDKLLNSRPTGELDCLFLNVFVNVENGNGTDGKLKPVLVYLHGGGFISGGSSFYHPDYFMDEDIVLVTVNYRLGPFGFLNLQGPEGPRGNMGLKDQTLALQWIQTNVALFGGDPNKVLLFGESAGSVASHLHVLSPMSNGLFHKALAQSGSATASWAFCKEPKAIAERYAKRLGCQVENNNSSSLWNCYKNMKWEELLEYQEVLMEPLGDNDFFQPSVDGEFLKEVPVEILKSGEFSTIPVMFGVNAAEGGIRTGRFDAMPELIPKLDEEWNDLATNLLVLEGPITPELAQKIRKQYFGDAKFVDDEEGFRRNLTLLISDAGFFNPVHKSAIYHANNGAPAYLFFYNYTSYIYPSTYSVYKAARLDDWTMTEVKLLWSFVTDWIKEFVFGGKGGRKYGVTHGDDIFQLWNVLGATQWVSGWDKEFSKSFVKVIVDFANDTKPLNFRESTWPSINDDLTSGKDVYSIPYMLLDNTDSPKVVPEPFGKRIQFWNELDGWEY